MGTKSVKILVIGAAGNLGLTLCHELTVSGHQVYGLCRPGSTLPVGIERIEMDLRLLNEEKLPQVDAVFYLAQSRHFREFPDQWNDIFEINVTLPLRIADWARRNKVTAFHYASSGGVYQGGMVAVRENAEINANRDTGFYIGSRLSAEILLRNFAPLFESFSLVRPFFIYGPNQARNMLIPRLVDSVQEGKEITLNGQEGIKINPIHVTDAARACMNLLNLKGFHAMNIAGTEVLTLKQLANKIGLVLKKEPVFKVVEGSSQDLVGDTELMVKLLHTPDISFENGVKDLI